MPRAPRRAVLIDAFANSDGYRVPLRSNEPGGPSSESTSAVKSRDSYCAPSEPLSERRTPGDDHALASVANRRRRATEPSVVPA